MSKKEYIAYQGSVYTIEWYFDEAGKSQSLDYVMNLNTEMQTKVFYLFKRMADMGKISDRTKFNNEGDKIYAFKPQPHRFLSFFVKDKKIIITNAFIKKTDKLPKDEKIRAVNYREKYLQRVEKGTYYEENKN